MCFQFDPGLDFNPRSHEESDLIPCFFCVSLFKFQSTLSRRERLKKQLTLFIVRTYFNPRSHEESDLLLRYSDYAYNQFQSTLSRRERPKRLLFPHLRQSISIHALTKRATCSRFSSIFTSSISIHALTKRATAIYSILWLNFYLEVLVILIVLHF